MLKRRWRTRCNRNQRERGQSLVEMALALPLLILVMAGTLEIGMYFNDYLTLNDAVREGARYSADNDYLNVDPNNDCGVTVDFYKQAACLVKQNMHGVTFDPARDDIVVSAVSVKDGQVVARYPSANGWSYCGNGLGGAGCVPAASLYSNAAILARLSQDAAFSTAPATGLVIVEIYHVHHQFLGLVPPGFPFIPQEVVQHAYTIMPLPSATPP